MTESLFAGNITFWMEILIVNGKFFDNDDLPYFLPLRSKVYNNHSSDKLRSSP